MNIFFKAIVLLGLSCTLYAGDAEKIEEVKLRFPASGQESFGVVVTSSPTATAVMTHFKLSGGDQYPYKEQRRYWRECAGFVKTGRDMCLKRAENALIEELSLKRFTDSGGVLYPRVGDVVCGAVFEERFITLKGLEAFVTLSGLSSHSKEDQMAFWHDASRRALNPDVREYCDKKRNELYFSGVVRGKSSFV